MTSGAAERVFRRKIRSVAAGVKSEAVLQALAETQRRLMASAGGISLLAYEYRGEFFDDLCYFDAANECFEVDPLSLREFEGELLDEEYGDEDGRWIYTYTHKPAPPLNEHKRLHAPANAQSDAMELRSPP